MTLNPIYKPSLPITIHRDQDQDRPLFNALEIGCKYIEFDLHLVDGSLLIGHDVGQPDKTMEEVYLKPLSDLAARGSLSDELTLIVDVKTKAQETFEVIQNMLEKYSSLLTAYDESSGLVKKSVRVIISGNRDKEAIAAANPRLAFYDGRIEDLFSETIDANLMPLVSEKWAKVFLPKVGWWSSIYVFLGGQPSVSDATVTQTITEAVARAARVGIAFRPWAMPDEEHTWALLTFLKEQGFVYNTDDPYRLANFLNTQQR